LNGKPVPGFALESLEAERFRARGFFALLMWVMDGHPLGCT
jgi:hypothetical protein